MKYKIAIYEPHKSGIGCTFIRYEWVTEKPTYDNYWFDCTNGEWAKTLGTIPQTPTGEPVNINQ